MLTLIYADLDSKTVNEPVKSVKDAAPTVAEVLGMKVVKMAD